MLLELDGALLDLLVGDLLVRALLDHLLAKSTRIHRVLVIRCQFTVAALIISCDDLTPLDFIDSWLRSVTVSTLIIVVRCCRVAAKRDDLKFLNLAHRIAVPCDHRRCVLHEAVPGLLAHHLLL